METLIPHLSDCALHVWRAFHPFDIIWEIKHPRHDLNDPDRNVRNNCLSALMYAAFCGGERTGLDCMSIRDSYIVGEGDRRSLKVALDLRNASLDKAFVTGFLAGLVCVRDILARFSHNGIEDWSPCPGPFVLGRETHAIYSIAGDRLATTLAQLGSPIAVASGQVTEWSLNDLDQYRRTFTRLLRTDPREMRGLSQVLSQVVNLQPEEIRQLESAEGSATLLQRMFRDGSIGDKLPSYQSLEDVIQLLDSWDLNDLSSVGAIDLAQVILTYGFKLRNQSILFCTLSHEFQKIQEETEREIDISKIISILCGIGGTGIFIGVGEALRRNGNRAALLGFGIALVVALITGAVKSAQHADQLGKTRILLGSINKLLADAHQQVYRLATEYAQLSTWHLSDQSQDANLQDRGALARATLENLKHLQREIRRVKKEFKSQCPVTPGVLGPSPRTCLSCIRVSFCLSLAV